MQPSTGTSRRADLLRTLAEDAIDQLVAGGLVDWRGVRPAFLALAGALLVVALAAIPARSLREFDAVPSGDRAG